MGLARHAQSTRVNLQCLCDILRKKSGMNLGALLHWLLQILLLQFIIHTVFFCCDAFPLSIWNPYQPFSSFDCLCNISSLLLFQGTVSLGSWQCFSSRLSSRKILTSSIKLNFILYVYIFGNIYLYLYLSIFVYLFIYLSLYLCIYYICMCIYALFIMIA